MVIMSPKLKKEIASTIPILCKIVRGKNSQKFINDKFEQKGNLVAKWEHGRRKISWAEFNQLCIICNYPLKRAVESIFYYYSELENQSALLKHILARDASIKDKSFANSSLPPLKQKNLLAEKSELQLEELFLLMDQEFEVWQFISIFLGDKAKNSGIEKLDKYLKAKELILNQPLAILLYTFCQGHKSNKIPAQKLFNLGRFFGHSENQTLGLIREFIELDVLKLNRNEYIFNPSAPFSVNTRGEDFKFAKSINTYFKNILGKNYQALPDRNPMTGSLMLFKNYKNDNGQKLQKIIRKFGMELGNIKHEIDDDVQKFVVVNISYQIVDPNET